MPPTCPTNAGWKVDSITYKTPWLPIKYPEQKCLEQDTIFGLEDCEHCKANREELLGLTDIIIKIEFYSWVEDGYYSACIRISRNCWQTSFTLTLPHSHLEDHAHSFYPHSNQREAVLWLCYKLWFHVLENFRNKITVSSRLLKTFKEKMTFLKELAVQGRFFDFFWELSFFWFDEDHFSRVHIPGPCTQPLPTSSFL